MLNHPSAPVKLHNSTIASTGTPLFHWASVMSGRSAHSMFAALIESGHGTSPLASYTALVFIHVHEAEGMEVLDLFEELWVPDDARVEIGELILANDVDVANVVGRVR